MCFSNLLSFTWLLIICIKRWKMFTDKFDLSANPTKLQNYTKRASSELLQEYFQNIIPENIFAFNFNQYIVPRWNWRRNLLEEMQQGALSVEKFWVKKMLKVFIYLKSKIASNWSKKIHPLPPTHSQFMYLMHLLFFHAFYVFSCRFCSFCKILCLFMCHVRREKFSICSCWHLAVLTASLLWDIGKVQWTDWPSWQSFMGAIKLNYWYIQRVFYSAQFYGGYFMVLWTFW